MSPSEGVPENYKLWHCGYGYGNKYMCVSLESLVSYP